MIRPSKTFLLALLTSLLFLGLVRAQYNDGLALLEEYAPVKAPREPSSEVLKYSIYFYVITVVYNVVFGQWMTLCMPYVVTAFVLGSFGYTRTLSNLNVFAGGNRGVFQWMAFIPGIKVLIVYMDWLIEIGVWASMEVIRFVRSMARSGVAIVTSTAPVAEEEKGWFSSISDSYYYYVVPEPDEATDPEGAARVASCKRQIMVFSTLRIFTPSLLLIIAFGLSPVAGPFFLWTLQITGVAFFAYGVYYLVTLLMALYEKLQNSMFARWTVVKK